MLRGRRGRRVASFLFFIIVAGGAGLYFYRKGFSAGDPLRLGKVQKGEITQKVTASGLIAPHRKTIITAPYNGYIKKIFVKVGDRVKAGDPLVVMSQSLISGEDNFPMRAPFSGTVVQIEKAEGEFLREGDTKEYILRIDDLDPLYVFAAVQELDRPSLAKGQEVVVKVSALLQKKFKGVIRELSLAGKDKDGYGRSQVEFPVRIEILEKDPLLQPGLSVVIDVITKRKSDVLILGQEFVGKDKAQYFVTGKDGKRLNVEIGLQNEEIFEIIQGLLVDQEVRQVDFLSLIQTLE